MAPDALSCTDCTPCSTQISLGDNNHQRAVKEALNNVAFLYGFRMLRSTWQVSRSGI